MKGSVEFEDLPEELRTLGLGTAHKVGTVLGAVLLSLSGLPSTLYFWSLGAPWLWCVLPLAVCFVGALVLALRLQSPLFVSQGRQRFSWDDIGVQFEHAHGRREAHWPVVARAERFRQHLALEVCDTEFSEPATWCIPCRVLTAEQIDAVIAQIQNPPRPDIGTWTAAPPLPALAAGEAPQHCDVTFTASALAKRAAAEAAADPQNPQTVMVGWLAAVSLLGGILLQGMGVALLESGASVIGCGSALMGTAGSCFGTLLILTRLLNLAEMLSEQAPSKLERRVRITPEGYHMLTAQWSVFRAWGEVQAVASTQKYALFFLQHGAWAIPASAFASPDEKTSFVSQAERWRASAQPAETRPADLHDSPAIESGNPYQAPR